MSQLEQSPASLRVQETDNWKPRFFLIWAGQASSLIGSALTQFVLLWWITETTGSASALATAGIAAMLPQALLGPLGGVLADRWSRRWIMVVADLITALCMVILILLFATGNIQIWHAYVLMAVRSSMQAFQMPAATASTTMLVPYSWLGRVAGYNQALQGIMTIAAAPLGALALAFLPIQGALMIDVVTALLGITPLFFFHIPQIFKDAKEQSNVMQELRAGVDYTLQNRGILMLLLVVGLVVMTILPLFSLTPLMVVEYFEGGVNQVAVMEGLSGVGIILGGVLVTILPLSRRRIVTVLISFAISCFAVALTVLGPSDWFWLGVFWWFISGIAYSFGNAPMIVIVQTVVPNEIQGRVFSLMNTVIGFAGPIGLAMAGPLGEAIGVRNVFILGGTVSGLICLAGLLSPALMSIEDAALPPPGDVEPQPASATPGP